VEIQVIVCGETAVGVQVTVCGETECNLKIWRLGDRCGISG